jgi:Flp pilus assembly protein TadD
MGSGFPAAGSSCQHLGGPGCTLLAARRKWSRIDVVNNRQNNSRDQALQQASQALQMQQFDQAQQLVSGLLKSNRTDRSAVLVLAHALIGQNRHVEAIMPLERVMRRNSDAEIETLLGAVLWRRGGRQMCLRFRNWQASFPKPDNLTKRSGPSRMPSHWLLTTSI